MFLTQRVHPYPFRTRKLSFAVPKILDWRQSGKIGQRRHKSRKSGESVILTQRVHPYPFRTRKLSFAVPKILDWRRSGKIGHSRHQRDMLDRKCIPYFIFLLSSVGRAGGTNYTGAIPIKADKKRSLKLYKFHIFLLSSVGSADRDLYTKRLCIRIYKIAV